MGWPTSVSNASNLFTAVNILQTQLTVAMTSNSPAVITVANTVGFPIVGALNIDQEVIFYTGISGNTFTGLTRGADNTNVSFHAIGANVNAAIVAYHINALNAEVIAIEKYLNTARSTDIYTIGTYTSTMTLNPASTTLNTVANVLATLLNSLTNAGIIQ
jgi:hypothetical protein